MIQRLHQLQADHQQQGGEEEAGSRKSQPDSRETEERRGGRRCTVKENGRKAKQNLSFSSSSSELLLGGSESCLWPLSLVMEQRLLLQYLTPLGDHQEVRARTCWTCRGASGSTEPNTLAGSWVHPGNLLLFVCSSSPSSCRWTRARC